MTTLSGMGGRMIPLPMMVAVILSGSFLAIETCFGWSASSSAIRCFGNKYAGGDSRSSHPSNSRNSRDMRWGTLSQSGRDLRWTRCSYQVSLSGWVQRSHDGEWEWQEDDPTYAMADTATVDPASAEELSSNTLFTPSATPQLPSGSYKPKQSLGQNYLKDPNTVARILRFFHQDAISGRDRYRRRHVHSSPSTEVTNGESMKNIPANDDWRPRQLVELGPGAGALTDKLIERYGTTALQVIELDDRSVQLLQNKHEQLKIHHADVMQIDYPALAREVGQPLVVVGNLPYYITSQILFALADASHSDAVSSATVTMQWEVAQRLVAPTRTKDYGILTVVFGLYCHSVTCHGKIPPTVFYPQPKVDSAVVGLQLGGSSLLKARLAGVQPSDVRRVVTTAFRQRRKTLRNSLKKLFETSDRTDREGDSDDNFDDDEGDYNASDRTPILPEILSAAPLPLPHSIQQARDRGDPFATMQELPLNWASRRPEELTPGQFVELTRLLYGPKTDSFSLHQEEDEDATGESRLLGRKIWRKLKHGQN